MSWKDGFSVVVPSKVIVPSSTCGRKVSYQQNFQVTIVLIIQQWAMGCKANIELGCGLIKVSMVWSIYKYQAHGKIAFYQCYTA